MTALERIPPAEAQQIAAIIALTRTQMERRYPAGTTPLRAQHAKAHACLRGRLSVRGDLPSRLQRGLFERPGRQYDVWVRYSNAASVAGADSTGGGGAPVVHGSRGMAIKVLDVSGVSLTGEAGPVHQDFLLVNHPVFPFANVDDYEAVTRVLTADGDNPARFFAERIRAGADGRPDQGDPVTLRTLRTLAIIRRIQSASTSADPPAFQQPPASPIENQYFGAAPFMFGDDGVMRLRVVPRDPPGAVVAAVTDPDYLGIALRERFGTATASEALFELQAQVREAVDLASTVDRDIEDASQQWDETSHPFVPLAVLTIPPQDVAASERVAACEALTFSPWHGIADHRPLGGINRLRRAVYEESARLRARSTTPLVAPEP